VTIVGVLLPRFDFGDVFAPGNRIDIYLPMPLSEETNRWGNTLAIIGRLRLGVTVQRAWAEFKILTQQIQQQHPERNTLRPVLTSLDNHVTGDVRRAFEILAWAIGIVMLIVCANIANLQLARGAARQKEMAVRVALGASRRRLIRQMLTESLALSCSGGVLGLFLALAGTRLLAGLDAFKIPFSQQLDWTALRFFLR
jgi:predicted lysophospholipase L1 biosynthesis ABC-type transport system permease subunit